MYCKLQATEEIYKKLDPGDVTQINLNMEYFRFNNVNVNSTAGSTAFKSGDLLPWQHLHTDLLQSNK